MEFAPTQSTLKTAVKVYLFSVLAGVICFFTNMSLFMIVTNVFTNNIGLASYTQYPNGSQLMLEASYQIDDNGHYVLDETGNKILWERIYLIQPDGTQQKLFEQIVDADKLAAMEADNAANTSGATSSPFPTASSTIHTPLNPGIRRTFDIWIQVLMMILFVAFPYSVLWGTGDRDRNLVEGNRLKENKHRGLKIGLLASVPAAACYAALLFCRATGFFDTGIAQYRLATIGFGSIVNFFVPYDLASIQGITPAAAAALFPPLLILPAVCWLSYLLGYNRVSLKDRIVYTATGKHLKSRDKRKN